MTRKDIREVEKKVLRDALEALRKTTELEFFVDVLPRDHEKGIYPDAIVHVGLPKYDKDWHFAIEVKPMLTRAILGVTIGQLEFFTEQQQAEKGLLVTKYVTPQIAEELKKKGIQFIDTAGNVYLNDPPLFIFVKGNRLGTKAQAVDINRAFRPAGLQVIFALLCRPGLVDCPFREIAQVANVALGTVGWVIKDLKKLGFLVDMGRRGRHLTRKKDLLNRWVTAYPDQLRPKQIVGRFKAPDNVWWTHIDDLRMLKAYWGGETGAALLTRFLKPQIATIYMVGEPRDLIFKYKLRKDPHGDIEILKTFWDLDIHYDNYEALVPHLLIYADLLATGDPRNIETAKQIYEQNIIELIRED